MSTTVVQLVGAGRDESLVDGPLPGDGLVGSFCNDTLFSRGFRSGDNNSGGDGFDQATLDVGDFAGRDIEKSDVLLGRMRLRAIASGRRRASQRASHSTGVPQRAGSSSVR